ncbi:proteasome activator pa28 beta subunit domain-containing protein [Ditylenchus destructor]|nr:proteasome activator pa28 beta subunit domain-containing protein [Ditylenchus destructor]
MISTIISLGTAKDSDSAIEESTPVSYLEITPITVTQFSEISSKLEMQDQSVAGVIKTTSPISSKELEESTTLTDTDFTEAVETVLMAPSLTAMHDHMSNDIKSSNDVENGNSTLRNTTTSDGTTKESSAVVASRRHHNHRPRTSTMPSSDLDTKSTSGSSSKEESLGSGRNEPENRIKSSLIESNERKKVAGDEICYDKEDCRFFREYCDDVNLREDMKEKCALTCGFCKPDPAKCYDIADECGLLPVLCNVYAYRALMQRMCRFTCNFCQPKHRKKPKCSDDPDTDCSKIDHLCARESYLKMMSAKCPYTCFKCQMRSEFFTELQFLLIIMQSRQKTEEELSLSEIKNGVFAKLDSFVYKKFPQKILELDKFLCEEKYSVDSLQKEASYSLETCLNKLSKKTQPTNGDQSPPALLDPPLANTAMSLCEIAIEMIAKSEPMLQEAIEDAGEVIFCIQCLTPIMEEGNNYGVDVQNECFQMARNMQLDTKDLLSSLPKYFERRASLLTKNSKYPVIEEDFCRCVINGDKLQAFDIRYAIQVTRNRYSKLYETLSKNIAVIKVPRDEDLGHLTM